MFEICGRRVKVVTGPKSQTVNVCTLSNWEITARRVTEAAIDQLVKEFVRYPYLHRCEHSIHCRLYELMVANKQLAEKLVFSHWVTQPVHKEWPEFIPRPGHRRGAFDLVVLAPDSVAAASLSDFQDGRIRPSLVIEMGLDYKYEHLSNDEQKLRNSGIADSYLIHLARQDVTDNFPKVESLLLKCGFKSAYVCHHRGKTARYKLVGDDSVTEVQV
jgi:hypothetical protein